MIHFHVAVNKSTTKTAKAKHTAKLFKQRNMFFMKIHSIAELFKMNT